MNLPLFATIFVLVFCKSQGQYCPIGTVRGVSPSDCYYYSSNSATWLRAEENCMLKGGHLASVSSAIINSVVKDAARISCQDEYWLGGNWNQYEPNAWAWSDGRRFSFTNWAQGQPASGGDICLAMNVRTGLWYSEAGSQQKPYVCKVPAIGNNAATCPTINTPTTPTCTCPTQPPRTPLACPTPKPLCLDGWTYIPQAKKCYKVPLQRGVTWLDCQNICRSVGGNLATIHSDNENYWLQ
ncbi:CLEC-50 protein, partial [Aphelenchoides avenae]